MSNRVSMDDWVTEHMADIAAEELRNEDSPHFEALMEAAAQAIVDTDFNVHKVLKALAGLDLPFEEVTDEQAIAAVKAAYKKAQVDR